MMHTTRENLQILWKGAFLLSISIFRTLWYHFRVSSKKWLTVGINFVHQQQCSIIDTKLYHFCPLEKRYQWYWQIQTNIWHVVCICAFCVLSCYWGCNSIDQASGASEHFAFLTMSGKIIAHCFIHLFINGRCNALSFSPSIVLPTFSTNQSNISLSSLMFQYLHVLTLLFAFTGHHSGLLWLWVLNKWWIGISDAAQKPENVLSWFFWINEASSIIHSQSQAVG